MAGLILNNPLPYPFGQLSRLYDRNHNRMTLDNAVADRSERLDLTDHLGLTDEEARELLREAQKYDDRALTRLYNLFAERIYRFCYFRLSDRERAEDLANEVFVRLLEEIGNFRLGASGHALALTGWIYTIARNLIIDDYRRQKVRSIVEPIPDDENGIPYIHLDVDLHITRADLQAAMAHLTEDQQTVVILRFEEGLTSAQVGTVMGKPESAVKALQRRGLATLARILTGEGALERTMGGMAE